MTHRMGSSLETAMGITLKQAYEQGSLRIALQCMRPRPGGVCGRVGKVEIADAIKRWGADRRLNEISARCSRCGSKDYVHVMGEPPGRPGKRGNR
jgi:hypothetical protein